jgi:hypothetical protein
MREPLNLSGAMSIFKIGYWKKYLLNKIKNAKAQGRGHGHPKDDSGRFVSDLASHQKLPHIFL